MGAQVACPKCGCSLSIVKDSRAGPENTVRRRRECTKCKERFSTQERIVKLHAGGRVQSFEPNRPDWEVAFANENWIRLEKRKDYDDKD